MKFPLYWIDAFATKPFHGNPAGVVPLEAWPEAELMQKKDFLRAYEAFAAKRKPAFEGD